MPSPATLGPFPKTRWSVVLRAQGSLTDQTSRTALEQLCDWYWYPLYAYARRCGRSPQDAEDLTQGFFARLVECDLITKADPNRGRLRSFLLGSFKHYMSEEWRRAHRQKRGGESPPIAIDQLGAEELYLGASPDALSPDIMFERTWFEAVLQSALKQLEEEYRRREQGDLFRKLQDFLAWNQGSGRMEALSRELHLSAGALRVAIHRLRHRFRQVLKQQVADTVGSAAEAEQELQHLRRVLGG